MTELEARLKLEHFVDTFYDKGEQHGSITLNPWEEVLTALTRAKAMYPTHVELIEHYIQRYQNIGDKSLEELMSDGCDIDGMTSDLARLKREFDRSES